jgi:glycerophosphoryl diester phosphodiesterase
MSVRPVVFAHRGASARRPENTVAAFREAVALGADGVELDVRRSADDILVVHHDSEADGVGLLRDSRFHAIRAARPDIPTLDEALAACGDLLVNVEVKCLPWEPDADGADRPVLRAVAELVRAERDRIIVSSFDLGAVDACHALAPELTTAWLTSGQDLDAAGAIAVERGHRWLHPDRAAAQRSSSAVVGALHDAGVGVNVWTVDDPVEMSRLAGLGVDGIISNVPDVALSVFVPKPPL